MFTNACTDGFLFDIQASECVPSAQAVCQPACDAVVTDNTNVTPATEDVQATTRAETSLRRSTARVPVTQSRDVSLSDGMTTRLQPPTWGGFTEGTLRPSTTTPRLLTGN